MMETAEQVRQKHNSGYSPFSVYRENAQLRETIDLIASGLFYNEQLDLFKNIIDGLLHNDFYMLFADYQSYIDMQAAVAKTYKDQAKWTEMSIINCANMGMFSSDRTITEYNKEIWKAPPVSIKLGANNLDKKSGKNSKADK